MSAHPTSWRTSLRRASASLMLAGVVCSASAEEWVGDLAASAPAPGASGTTIDAQRIEVYLDREMRAFGDAEIHTDGKVIKGDRIDYNSVSHELHATGNVSFQQEKSLVEGTELRLKTEDREGEMNDPVFHLGVGSSGKKSRGSAKTLFFEGPTKERLQSARYTTCEDGRDDWYLRAGEMEINHHTDTATATHASVEFKGVPILYTPWIDFPFDKQQRKTGLLSPTWGTTTRSGFEVTLPYYWNIAPDMDATIAPRYLSKRGVQLQGEFRYLDTSYSGTDAIELLPSDDMTDRDRYMLNLQHTHTFGNGWSGNIHYERVSDDQYFSDLTSHVIVTSRVNLLQEGSLHYDSANWHFSALAQKYQTLDKASFPYQRLPQLTLTGTESIGPVDTGLWTEYVRFERDSSAPVAVEGSRYTVYPTVSLPLTRAYGYVTPKLGLHYTRYDLKNTGTQYDSDTRTLPIFSVDSGLYFDRDMRVVNNRYTQTLEPRLYYVYIPEQDQSRLPIFDTGLSDVNLATIFTENQFSGGDRINDANQITFGLTSRLIDQQNGVQRLSATLAQRYYFNDQQVVMPGTTARQGKHSDIFAALSVNLINHWSADAALQYNWDTGQTQKGNLSTRYQPEPGKVLNLAYRFTRDSLEQVDLSSEWPLGGNWYSLGRINYSIQEKKPIEYLGGVEYNAGCWLGRAVMQRLQTATAEANYAMFFQVEFDGMSSIGTNPLELLKRNIPGYTNSYLIPNAPK